MNTITPRPRINWIQAKMLYTDDHTLSYADIAQRFNVSLKEVKKHGARDDWVGSRQEVAMLAESRIANKLVDERVAINDRHIRMYRNTQSIANAYIKIINNELKRLQEQAENEGRPLTSKELFSTQSLLSLVQTMKLAIEGERVAMDLPTVIVAAQGWQPQPPTQPVQPLDDFLASVRSHTVTLQE